MKFLFVSILLIIALILEGTVTTIPLVLLCLLSLTIYRRDALVFPVAFVLGIFLDIFAVRIIGVSSLFFTIVLFLILLYQRKYEINSYPFVAAAGFLGSAGFLLIFGYGSWFTQALLSALIAVIIFATSHLLQKAKSTQQL